MIAEIARLAEKNGWACLIVGGFVRDQVLNRPSKDIDLEFYGPTVDELREFLGQFGEVKAVGASFGVFKLRVGNQDIDCSLPRRESKSGSGHRGFVTTSDPNMSPEEAAARRDFTMNSMAMHVLSGEIYDPFGGRLDLESGTLRHTGPAFADDPLRVLRGMQFCSRFCLIPAWETVELCQALAGEFHTLSLDRIWGEWEKWARGESPALGLCFLNLTNWLDLFPELQALKGLEQDREHHPEGDVWYHTLQTVEMAADIAAREGLSERDRIILVFAALCHDLGKASTTTWQPGKGIRSYGHNVSDEPQLFLERIGAPKWLVEQVLPLVREHMAHVFVTDVTGRTARRLAERLQPASIKLWALLVEADHSGRSPMPPGMPAKAQEIMDIACRLGVVHDAPKPILMGRHLIELGLRPSTWFGFILREAFEAQLDGEFTDLEGALAWMRKDESAMENLLHTELNPVRLEV